MQVSVETLEGLQRRITVELPAEQVNKAVEKKLADLARNVRLDGFRPGKVPLKVIRQRFGQQARQDAWGDMIQDTYYKAIVQEGLKPAGDPSIDDIKDEGESFIYSAKIEILPEIEIGDLSSAEVETMHAEVTDTDVDSMLEKLRQQRVTYNTVDGREAVDGDQVTVSFVGKVDGEEFEGGAAESVPIVLGSGAMIDGFESGILGAKAGDERTIEVNFPDNYRAEHLAGKPATFDITVKAVAEPVLPEIDEEFARAYGVEDGSVETFRKDIRENMERELTQKIRQKNKEKVMDVLLEKHVFDVPSALVTSEAERMKQETKQNMQQQGGAQESFELPVDLFKEQAERRVKLGMLVAEIVDKNKISVDDMRVRETVETFASSYETPQEVIDWYYGETGRLDAVKNIVLEDQVVDWLLGQMKVEEKQASFDDLSS